jgi:hypothetical protein
MVQTTQPKFPPPSPPPPRSDLPPIKGMSDEEYAEYVAELTEEGPSAWIDTDGTLYMEWMPSQMAPPVGGPVDSTVGISPDSPEYGKYAQTVLREFNYQGMEEVPDAAGTDDDAESG